MQLNKQNIATTIPAVYAYVPVIWQQQHVKKIINFSVA